MKKKLALTFGSIQHLSKKEQKDVNGGWGSSCPGGYNVCGPPWGFNSTNHPCVVGGPYYSGQQNCINYCNSGGCCCP
jgi:hypothetical protein